MKIREEVESLLIYFVIATALTVGISLFISINNENIILYLVNNNFSSEALVLAMKAFGQTAALIDNLAIAIWLFRRASQVGYNKYLWCIFGLVGTIFSGILYVLIRVSENINEQREQKLTSLGVTK